MPNTSFKGMHGKVAFNGGDIANVTTWNATFDCEMLDSTILGESDWKDFLANLKSWTGTIECNMDASAFNIALDDLGEEEESSGVPTNIQFWFGATEDEGILYGDCLVNSMNPSSSKEIVKFTANFQGVGTPAYVVVEPA